MIDEDCLKIGVLFWRMLRWRRWRSLDKKRETAGGSSELKPAVFG
jgi:hypothetical protein